VFHVVGSMWSGAPLIRELNTAFNCSEG
jgi:hypothetical protein